ncbi:hypothetical protein BOTBODRAFT_261616 [Botryobasidium botryosum FD-172 SS1]|uniref:Xylanolytic transcriptional activator regulatory domain-containing protein n=1 Tax=Botryobasidium botryosum (strain FD-172 SS1) TaxID=930990 RepID=A0A067MXY3_BOTB1|nr:hypothetical protein BOTBODRAFT_261616 [Botryobasidium botryosum FD-172 SS1]
MASQPESHASTKDDTADVSISASADSSGASNLPDGCTSIRWGEDPVTVCRWWERPKLPQCYRYHLINIFLPHRLQCSMNIHVPRFLARIDLPSSDPGAVHPALINAMCLIACGLLAPEPLAAPLAALEAQFIKETRFHLPLSLALADRLIDFLMASCLLGWYYAGKGRLTEAHLALASASRFAAGCGLHQISSRSVEALEAQRDRGSRSLLGPPADSLELAERINAFWMAFLIDRTISMGTNWPAAFSDEEIETVLPACYSKFESDSTADLPNITQSRCGSQVHSAPLSCFAAGNQF